MRKLTIADYRSSHPVLDVFYKVDGVKSGMHHPDGMLWIRAPGARHAVHPTHVPLATVAPTILERFGVPRPRLHVALGRRVDGRRLPRGDRVATMYSTSAVLT